MQAVDALDRGALHAELDQLEPAHRAWAEAIELHTAAGAEDEAEELRRWVADLDP